MVAASLVVSACGSINVPSASVAPSLAPGSAAPRPSPSRAVAETPSPSLPSSDVLVDPGLLSFLPPGGADVLQMVDPDTTGQVAQDPELRANASAMIIAVYRWNLRTPSPGPADDLAVASVVRLRDPSKDDAWFRDWRDSYDTAACANAGGVARNSQTDIGTHTVFIGSCAGGSFTYHTRVAGGAIVISITSIGATHLGETIMERLAP
jgi:hypothetical protein